MVLYTEAFENQGYIGVLFSLVAVDSLWIAKVATSIFGCEM